MMMMMTPVNPRESNFYHPSGSSSAPLSPIWACVSIIIRQQDGEEVTGLIIWLDVTPSLDWTLSSLHLHSDTLEVNRRPADGSVSASCQSVKDGGWTNLLSRQLVYWSLHPLFILSFVNIQHILAVFIEGLRHEISAADWELFLLFISLAKLKYIDH